jgi:hypothetical protein
MLRNQNIQEMLQMLSLFGDNFNLANLDQNTINSLLQYTPYLKTAKDTQNNENFMENFLSHLNATKPNEIQKDEEKKDFKNHEFIPIGKDALSKYNEKSERNIDINDVIKKANILNDFKNNYSKRHIISNKFYLIFVPI